MRRQTVEHPFGTIKAWMDSTHFLTRTLKRVSTEMSLHVLAYNLKRMITIFGVGPADGGDQDLIASFKPHVSVDLSGIPMVLQRNTAHRPLHPTRFPTVSGMKTSSRGRRRASAVASVKGLSPGPPATTRVRR